MNDDRSLERAARSWLEEGPTRAPDRTVDAALTRIQTTRQERDWIPWRLPTMNPLTRLAAIAVIGVIAVGGSLYLFGRDGPGVGGQPTPIPSPSGPLALRGGPLAAGAYVVMSFPGPIRFTLTVPDGWAGAPFDSLWLPNAKNSHPDGAGLIFDRGGRLSSDPCGGPWDIPVGPSIDDFANALAEHPILGATTPVDVTLDGYSGKFLEFRAPADRWACQASFFPWENSLYVQGPSQGWHLWILDVEGTRVVVQTNDYPGTSVQHRAELQAIVDSIQIEP